MACWNFKNLAIHIFQKSFLKIILYKNCLLFPRNLAGLSGGQVKHQVRATPVANSPSGYLDPETRNLIKIGSGFDYEQAMKPYSYLWLFILEKNIG
jgi:hypothetical protein